MRRPNYTQELTALRAAAQRETLTGSAMAHRRGFFATLADLEPGIRRFEAASPALYVLAGLFDSAELRSADSALDLHLGRADTGAMVTEDAYLVLVAGSDVAVRSVPQRTGETRFAIYGSLNPDSVVCCFGGVHVDRVLISGEVSTMAASGASRDLFKSLARQLTKGFECIGSYLGRPRSATAA